MKEKLRKVNKIIVVFLVLFLVVAVGYALFSEDLNVNGTVTASGDFNLTYQCGDTILHGSGARGNCFAKDNTVTTTSSFTKPGEWILYDVKVTNTGSIPVVLKKVNSPNNVLMDGMSKAGDEVFFDKTTALGSYYMIYKNDATGNKLGKPIYGNSKVESANITMQPGDSITIEISPAWADSNGLLPEQPVLPEEGAGISYDLTFVFQQA